MPADHEWDATDQARERVEQANPKNPPDAQQLIDYRAKLARGGLTAGERATVQAQIDAIEAKRPADQHVREPQHRAPTNPPGTNKP